MGTIFVPRQEATLELIWTFQLLITLNDNLKVVQLQQIIEESTSLVKIETHSSNTEFLPRFNPFKRRARARFMNCVDKEDIKITIHKYFIF